MEIEYHCEIWYDGMIFSFSTSHPISDYNQIKENICSLGKHKNDASFKFIYYGEVVNDSKNYIKWKESQKIRTYDVKGNIKSERDPER